MYGENSGQLRDALTTLLRQHRIQQRLGGPGSHTIPETTTAEEREALGGLIACYRHGVLVWCRDAARAANPRIDLHETTTRSRGPAEELRYRIDDALTASTAGLPTLTDLTAHQDFEMVESWRAAAKAAALGEHDFTAGVGYGRLDERECMAVLQDAADVTRALVALDHRYDNIPGWGHLKNPGRLGRAAEVCVAYARYDEPSYSVDSRGWRPPAGLLHGPASSRLAAVVQAEHNLLVQLARFPKAHTMRLVLDSQRVLSEEAAKHIGSAEPTLARGWARRGRIYTALVQQTRDLRGLAGVGGPIAAQASVVATRVPKLWDTAPGDLAELRKLDRLFGRVDNRVADIIDHGVMERLYFLRVKTTRLDTRAEGLVRQPHTRHVPLNSAFHPELLETVRNQLRPNPGPPRAPDGAAQRRAEFEAAISHRPTPRGASPDAPSL